MPKFDQIIFTVETPNIIEGFIAHFNLIPIHAQSIKKTN